MVLQVLSHRDLPSFSQCVSSLRSGLVRKQGKRSSCSVGQLFTSRSTTSNFHQLCGCRVLDLGARPYSCQGCPHPLTIPIALSWPGSQRPPWPAPHWGWPVLLLTGGAAQPRCKYGGWCSAGVGDQRPWPLEAAATSLLSCPGALPPCILFYFCILFI